MSFPGNFFDRQRARRDPEELHNYSRNLAISLAILRTELRKVEAKNHCNQYLYLAFRQQQKKSGRQNKWDLCSKHDNSELSPLVGASAKKNTDRTEFPSWIVNFSGSRVEATSSPKDLTNPKSITRKDFSDYKELDLMMAAKVKWCYDIAYLIYYRA